MSKVIGIRLQPEYEQFYQEQASKRKMTLSAYLRQVLVEAHTHFALQETEQRIENLLTSNSINQAMVDASQQDIMIIRLILTQLYRQQHTVEQTNAVTDKAREVLAERLANKTQELV